MNTPRSPQSSVSLGATLYTPATHPRLTELISGARLSEARSLVICTEDAIASHDLERALDQISSALDSLDEVRPQCFLRPRDLTTLAELLRRGDAQRFSGVVLPKIDEHNIRDYGELLALAPELSLMPTVEGEVAFYRARLEKLREALGEISNRVLCVRVGGNDLLQLLGIKRPPQFTIYETPLRSTLNDLIVTFRPAGYELSAPVFDYLNDEETLRREVELDLAYGLVTKTAIHPRQISVIERLYRVTPSEINLARSLTSERAPAVFQMSDQMCEPSTHRAWAERLLERAACFGVS